MWSEIATFENLYQAYLKARQGKQNREEVSLFSFHLEEELIRLEQELVSLRWQPGNYRQFTLYERKPRIIAAAPFRDRVVQHAIMNIVEPKIDPEMYEHSYACRRNKGVHAAVNYYQHCSRQFAYVLKLDISRYFPSVDHKVLKDLLSRYLKDPKLLQMLGRIIDSYPPDQTPGLNNKRMPIGNLTSQFFANLYLDKLDDAIVTELGCKAYLRYVDDLVLLSNNKAQLWHWLDAIQLRLNRLKLVLHPYKINLSRTSEKVDMFGYQVSRHKRWLRNDNGYRFRRRLKTMSQQYALGNLELDAVKPRIMSWIGHAQHGETEGLRKSIFDEMVFKRR